jgi:MFS family permease
MVKDWEMLLTNKRFWYIWISQIFSQVTINILNFALLFTLFEKTGSTIATSFLWIAYALPALIIGPIASASVDVFDRRKILVLTNLFQAILIFTYALLANTSSFYVYVVVLIYSTLNQFYVPSEFATLPHVVSEPLLAQANGLFLITQQASLILGFGVAGVVLNAFGFRDTLIFCGLLLFVAFISTYFLPKMKPEHDLPRDFEKGFLAFFENIVSGVRFIAENKFILAPFLILVSMQVSLAITTVNAPAIAREIMRVPVAYAGTYLVVPGGVGAALASIVIPRLLNRGERKIKIIKSSLLTLLFSLFLLTFIFSELEYVLRVISSFVALIMIGFSYVGIIIPSQTFLQEKTPFNLRGRVFGNYWFLVTVISIFPVILSGTVSEIFGAHILMFILMATVFGLFLFLKDREKKYLLPENGNGNSNRL